jgi:recombination protein RecA
MKQDIFAKLKKIQERGGVCALVDGTHLVDAMELKEHGIDIDELYISQPDTPDQADEIAETLQRSGAIDYVLRVDFQEWVQDRKVFDDRVNT